MQQFMVLLGGETAAAAQQTPGSIWTMLLIYGAFFLVLWFILIRPQRKRQKAIAQMQSNAKVGDSVLTTGGLYGKVVDDIGEVLIVEFGTNKSVRVPVQRDSIASIKEPELSVAKETTEDTKE